MGRPGLTIHPKFRRLVHLLSIPAPHVLGHLEFLWIPAYENGNPEIGDVTDIELAAGWVGEAGKLCKALLECGGTDASGFIEEVPGKPGKYQVHDLYDHAPEYVRKRFDRESARQQTGKTLSEVRREAAQKRWKSGEATDASVMQTAATCIQTDANGCKCHANGTPPAPAPAPAPAHTEGGRKRPVFVKPSLENVRGYFSEKSLSGDPEEFFDHYEANGWKQSGGQPLKEWHAAARQWSRRQPQFAGRHRSAPQPEKPAPPMPRFADEMLTERTKKR